jgi:teichuronic acid biosynthesis glycosyltransferase TuaC
MNTLVVVSNYPHPGHRFSGIFNERSVAALKEHCEFIAVLAPRPYVPKVLKRVFPVRRWHAYAQTVSFEVRNGVPVHRPPYLQIPRIASTFWQETGAYLCCVWTALALHARYEFDAVLSFGLDGSGGVGWRLGRRLGIPVAVWATGSDIRKTDDTAAHESVIRTLKNADLVIYQSRELLEIAARALKKSKHLLSFKRHVVLSRGIPEPPTLPKDELRKCKRSLLSVSSDEILVLYIGRVTRSKGMLELLEAISLAASQSNKVKCIIVGSKPSFDETVLMEKAINTSPDLRQSIKLLPACEPEEVWEYLCAADIFVFPSHNEGMPNSLLEAMVMGVPSIAFAIPPVLELEAGTGAVVLVPPFSTAVLSDAILRLASSRNERARIGRIGKEQVLQRFMARDNMKKAYAYLARVVEERTQAKDAISAMDERSAISADSANYNARH